MPKLKERLRIGPWRPFLANVALVIGILYVGGVLAINLEGTPAWVIFPRIGQSAINLGSIGVEWSDIQQNYFVRNPSVDGGTQGAEQGMVSALKQKYKDNFSQFFTATDYKTEQSLLSGTRAGAIGVSLDQRCAGEIVCGNPNELVFEDILSNQPADKAGIKRNDILVSVDGKLVTSMGATLDAEASAAAAGIRGQAGSPVQLVVVRAGIPMSFTVTRQNLQIPSVYSQTFGSTVCIQITSYEQSTGSDARDALSKALAGGAKSVILDLRANGGGYVDSAITLVSQFVAPTASQHDVLVLRGRMDAPTNPGSAQDVQHKALQSGGVATNPKLVVLVDGGTASAAEITAQALREYHRATLVGQKTFGKGSVQEDFPLPDGSDLHLTVEKWYGPNGDTIDGVGLAPDQVVSIDSADSRFRLDAQGGDPAGDPQFQAALVSATS
jgi:carboxyl-terminal processing protease